MEARKSVVVKSMRNKRLRVEQPLSSLLKESLNSLRRRNQSREPVFRSMRKREQNAIIMSMLTRINFQILKFNVKKLFQIWALYHPEDVNCQIIAQVMFKKTAKCDIETIRRELQAKNSKIKKNSSSSSSSSKCNSSSSVGSSGGFRGFRGVAAATIAAAAAAASATFARLKREGAYLEGLSFGSSTAAATGGLYATMMPATTVDHHESPARTVRAAVDPLSPNTKFNLFRCVDNRGLLQCSKLFDANIYHVKDLPLILCYTDYHIDQLIKICQTSKNFPIDLLPRYLQKQTAQLLKL